MKAIFQNPFLAGLFVALSVVASDFLNAYVLHPNQPFSFQALAVAAGIALAGYLGKYLTGSNNTVLAMVGSGLIAVVPLITTGKINWSLVAATFAIKFLGLVSEGKATVKGAGS